MTYNEVFGDRAGGPDRVAVLAHRGGVGPWRENTLEAFAAAVAAGADGVELDVRRTADGELVVHHDARVEGMDIFASDRSELPPHVALLVDTLEVCAGSIVNVEIKNSPLEVGHDPEETVAVEVPQVLAAASAAGRGPERVVVSSFSPATLQAVRMAAPDLATGLLVHPSLDPEGGLEVAFGLGCRALNPHLSQVTAALVARAHDMGLAVVTWTVNDLAELAAVVGAGVDVVITDHVAEVLAGLDRG